MLLQVFVKKWSSKLYALPHRLWQAQQVVHPEQRKPGREAAGSIPPVPDSEWPTAWAFLAFSNLSFFHSFILWSLVQVTLLLLVQSTWLNPKRKPVFVVMDVSLHLLYSYAASLADTPAMADDSKAHIIFRGRHFFLTWNYSQPPSCRDPRREHTCPVQPCGSGKIEIALIHHLTREVCTFSILPFLDLDSPFCGCLTFKPKKHKRYGMCSKYRSSIFGSLHWQTF